MYGQRMWLLGIACVCLTLASGVVTVAADVGWPQWRGPEGTGVAPNATPPTQWSVDKNIRWKSALPGRGHSSPIVWSDRIFLSTAIPIGNKLPPKMSGRPGEHDNLPVDSKYAFVIMAIDRKNGSILWKRTVREAVPVEAGHYTASLTSASMVTDGARVFANFGSQGVYCFDLDGQLLWQRDFGQMHTKHGHGEGSSPTISDGSLIINWDHEEKSFLTALDTASGKDLWRRDRLEDTSWSSPIVIDHEGQKQIIVCGTNRIRGYSLTKGDVLWECAGLSSNVVATPVYSKGILYAGSSYEKRALLAIDLRAASGDISGTKHLLWTRTRATPYVPSMLLYDNQLYFLNHYQNIVTRVDGLTGKDSPGPLRLGSLGNIYASPVAANGHVYITDLEGTTEVLSNGPIPRTVAINRLEENVFGSLAVVGEEIFIRGEKHLYCIAIP